MDVGVSMVMLREAAAPSAARVEQELRTRYPDLDAVLDSDNGSTVSIRLRDGDFLYTFVEAPIPWSDLEGPCATSLLWKNAADEVKAHCAHLIVAIRTELNAVERSTLLTKVTVALLAASDAAIGVYWGNATLVIPKAIFLEFAEQILPLGPPVDIWIDFRVGWQEEKRSAGFTQGLTALGHMELVAQDSPEKPGDLRERFHGLAGYLLEHGPVIKDGDTIGNSAKEKIRVVYGPSSFGHEGFVMQLHYEAAPAKPWWKIW
jgi:uncharacterized protein DUF4261